MRNLLTIALVSVFLLSCTRDNDGLEQTSETVSLNLELDLNLSLEKTNISDKGAGLTNKFSEFEHIFKDEVDLVFTSTTTTFSTTLTITPNDLSNTPTLVIPYGTYSWSISDNEPDGTVDYFLRSYLPIYGDGSVEIYSSEVSIDLLVDTDFGLVTVEKENISSAKIAEGQYEKDLVLLNNYYYIYALENDGYNLSVNESMYNTTIETSIDNPNILYSKTHYNFILAFSNVSVNSIIIKSAPFTQYDNYLQPESLRNYKVGDDAFGGKVFYIFQEGEYGYIEGEIHGFVLTKEDLGEVRWTAGSVGDFKDIGLTLYNDSLDGSDIGKGKVNCELIKNYKTSNSISGTFNAIELALNYEGDGYDDWYLPSIGELKLMRDNISAIGESFFSDDKYYWSSSLMDNKVGAMSLNMSVTENGYCGCAYFESYVVKAVREF